MPTCEPLPPYPVVAVADLDEGAGGRRLVVAGKRSRTGDAGGAFEVIDAQLLLTTNVGCVLGRAPIGEMSRPIDEAGAPPAAEQAVRVGRLGDTEGNTPETLAVERGAVGDDDVVIVYVPLDVKWGLTEYHLVVFTIDEGRLVAGARVQSGRDGLGGDVYYGHVQVVGDELMVERIGPGGAIAPIPIRRGGDGVFVAAEPSEEAPEEVAASARDGHDRDHALWVCGPRGALGKLASGCLDGQAGVTREGSVGPARDGHMLDAYRVTCGESAAKVFVDIYHCP